MKKAETFGEALATFERLVREHQMETLREYKADLARGVEAYRRRLAEMYHAKVKGERS